MSSRQSGTVASCSLLNPQHLAEAWSGVNIPWKVCWMNKWPFAVSWRPSWVWLVLIRLVLSLTFINRYWWLFKFLFWILSPSQDVRLFNIHSFIHSFNKYLFIRAYYVWGRPLMIPNWAIFSPVEFQLRKKSNCSIFQGKTSPITTTNCKQQNNLSWG